MSNIQLFNECNMEVMARYPDGYFDLAIVDPPYGIDWTKQIQNPNTKANWKKYDDKGWDKEAPSKSYFDELIRVSKHQIIWGGNYMTGFLYPTPCWVIWDKMQEFSGATFEMAWTSFSSPAKAFRMSRVEAYANQDKIHPTQKPVKLYKWLLKNYATPDMKILDTHLGSMSSVIAAYDYQIAEFVGCEIDSEYFEKGRARFEQHKRQLNLFAA